MVTAQYLLDTNVIIELIRKGHHAEQIEQLGKGAVVISVITYHELYVGIEKSPSKNLALKKTNILENILKHIEILQFQEQEAIIGARIRAKLESAGKMIGANDLLIAASALAHNLTLVTNNTKEFQRVPGLKVINWNKA
jgi:tRNA(fMet)-specific endonuclease VapC